MPRIRIVLDSRTNAGWTRALLWTLAALLATNQVLVGRMMPASPAAHASILRSLLGAKTASATVIVMPKLNPDGKTTSLMEQPTIDNIPANPSSGDAVADAKVVMIGSGTPFYAPSGISFNDAVNAEKLWGAYVASINLSSDLQSRYDALTTVFTCNYCCGEPGNVTRNKQCGCAHSQGARGFFKYMLQTYGDKYSNDQLMGEAFRWQAIWYPKGAVEDYLLATGRSNVLGHETHGGAGTDGRHGFKT